MHLVQDGMQTNTISNHMDRLSACHDGGGMGGHAFTVEEGEVAWYGGHVSYGDLRPVQ